jgi:hypothetical protein
MKKDKEKIIETATEARQGERGPTVFNVLTISMAATIIVFAIVWFIFFRT